MGHHLLTFRNVSLKQLAVEVSKMTDQVDETMELGKARRSVEPWAKLGSSLHNIMANASDGLASRGKADIEQIKSARKCQFDVVCFFWAQRFGFHLAVAIEFAVKSLPQLGSGAASADVVKHVTGKFDSGLLNNSHMFFFRKIEHGHLVF